MRLIDADELKEYKCDTCDNRERCEDREQVCSEIADIDEQPTIEAEPVKHGRWIDLDGTPFAKCSVCGEKHYGCITPYCDMCGARMDGDET